MTTRTILLPMTLLLSLAGSGCNLGLVPNAGVLGAGSARYATLNAIAAPPLRPLARAGHDHGEEIDVEAENLLAAERLRSLAERDDQVEFPLVVVPGFAGADPSRPLSARAEERLDMALEALEETGAHAILLSGGNVRPVDTPFNEALEMKRHLLRLGIPADRILIEPYARHSTTNMRNAGRTMLALGVERALVVTTFAQNFYFGFPVLSSYHLRCLVQLGHTVGSLDYLGPTRSAFEPSPEVFALGPDPLDP